MSTAAFLRHGLCLLVPLALASSLYLYLYPYFNGCAFPLPSRDAQAALDLTTALHWPARDAPHPVTKAAPFRLLTLADPQLEGDTSIPTAVLGTFPHARSIVRHLTFQTEHWSLHERLRQTAHDAVDLYFEDVPNLLASWRKRFDLLGNDFYLAHVYRTMHWWARPTHVTVLGDLVGSQWIDDDEFERRGKRFWQRAFRGGQRVPDEVASWPEHEYDLQGMLGEDEQEGIRGTWERRIINVAGNHDIGYAGDLTWGRLERFERVFGRANYELRFGLRVTDDANGNDAPRPAPQLRIVVLNDMNLDTPAGNTSLQDATYDFLNRVINTSPPVESPGVFTLVLTHVPLHKPEGVCVDPPLFYFHDEDDGGGLKEQNLLSADASRGFLEGVFGMSGDSHVAGRGMGRQGLVLNGHDHEGCDTYHFINQTKTTTTTTTTINGTTTTTTTTARSWQVATWPDAQARGLPSLATAGLPGRREITVRSMMGDFGGNAGLLSVWFDEATWQWEHEFVNCALGTQHLWWLTHLLDLAALVFLLLYVIVQTASLVGIQVDNLCAASLRFK